MSIVHLPICSIIDDDFVGRFRNLQIVYFSQSANPEFSWFVLLKHIPLGKLTFEASLVSYTENVTKAIR